MVRPADSRAPAAPGTRSQALRRARVLAAAAELGARDGLDGVQMHDVAKLAGVAIGTLYRYFPSKTQLFATVWDTEIARSVEDWEPGPSLDPVGAVGELLVGLTRQLVARPRLAEAMVRSATAAYSSVSPAEAGRMLGPLGDAMMRALGDCEHAGSGETRAKLLQYAWWGILFALLAGKTAAADAEGEIRLAARLLLSVARPEPGR